eukprot:9967434-Lingulodinium_polyedra.AAC.1
MKGVQKEHPGTSPLNARYQKNCSAQAFQFRTSAKAVQRPRTGETAEIRRDLLFVAGLASDN